MTSPAPVFKHLLRLTDRRGTLACARVAEPLPEHGYCTDDMTRVLIVATRHHGPDQVLNGLAGVALQFLNDAQALTGGCRNNLDSTGNWLDEPALEDAWGRCIWALGTAAARSNVARTAGHLSPIPVAGRGAGDARPGFDQKPIAASTLADACARAAIDPDPIWPAGVRAAADLVHG